jgi:hypothetical protein
LHERPKNKRHKNLLSGVSSLRGLEILYHTNVSFCHKIPGGTQTKFQGNYSSSEIDSGSRECEAYEARFSRTLTDYRYHIVRPERPSYDAVVPGGNNGVEGAYRQIFERRIEVLIEERTQSF